MSLSIHIDVIPAEPEQQPILANLLELYAHDFSEFHDIELGPDGRFGYKDLALYWREPGRHPFIVKVDGSLAGLVLVKKIPALEASDTGGETVCDMAEFFIVRRYRRRGIGSRVAHQIWEQFPGPWQIRVMKSNHAGRIFWEHAIAQFSGPNQPTLRVG